MMGSTISFNEMRKHFDEPDEDAQRARSAGELPPEL
jgi:hypothetical protein